MSVQWTHMAHPQNVKYEAPAPALGDLTILGLALRGSLLRRSPSGSSTLCRLHLSCQQRVRSVTPCEPSQAWRPAVGGYSEYDGKLP